jgi:hypothetical protein
VRRRFDLAALIALLVLAGRPGAGQVSPEEWGAPPVKVSRSAGKWTMAGKKNTAVLDEKDLSLTVQAGPTTWKMVPSSTKDLLVRATGRGRTTRSIARRTTPALSRAT